MALVLPCMLVFSLLSRDNTNHLASHAFRTLYRGLQDLCMPEDLLSFGPGSISAFVEPAFASCSTRKEVALQYAGPCDCLLRKDEEDVVYCSRHKSTLLQISTGAIDCGAWLGWVSQYPEEDEYCLPAGSFFEVSGVRRERHANVFEVSFRENRSGVTLDVLREQRKTCALNLIGYIFHLRSWWLTIGRMYPPPFWHFVSSMLYKTYIAIVNRASMSADAIGRPIVYLASTTSR